MKKLKKISQLFFFVTVHIFTVLSQLALARSSLSPTARPHTAWECDSNVLTQSPYSQSQIFIIQSSLAELIRVSDSLLIAQIGPECPVKVYIGL